MTRFVSLPKVKKYLTTFANTITWTVQPVRLPSMAQERLRPDEETLTRCGGFAPGACKRANEENA